MTRNELREEAIRYGTYITNEPPPELLNGDARELWRQATIIVETPQTNDRLTELALSIRRELRDESRIARLEQDNRILRGTIAMACDRLGGIVDGKPPHEGNFLQRIDELRCITEFLDKIASCERVRNDEVLE